MTASLAPCKRGKGRCLIYVSCGTLGGRLDGLLLYPLEGRLVSSDAVEPGPAGAAGGDRPQLLEEDAEVRDAAGGGRGDCGGGRGSAAAGRLASLEPGAAVSGLPAVRGGDRQADRRDHPARRC